MAAVTEVAAAVVSASGVSARTADMPEPYHQESGSAPASMQVEEEWLVSAQKQSKQPRKSAPQKKENPWSALAPHTIEEIGRIHGAIQDIKHCNSRLYLSNRFVYNAPRPQQRNIPEP